MKRACHKNGKGFLASASIFLVFLCLGLACSENSAAMSNPSSGIQSIKPGNHIRLLQVDGLERSYIYHVPRNYSAQKATPLILVIHGGGSSAYSFLNITHFNRQAEKSGFIAVYPNGVGDLVEHNLTWNAGDCCGYAQEQASADVEFIRLLLDDVGRLVNIDPQRIYATGMSNGAMFTYRLACDLSDRIAAIAPVSGTHRAENCAPSRPVSILQISGTADPHTPVDRSMIPAEKNFPHPTLRESLDFWIAYNGCPQAAITQNLKQSIHETYAPCKDSTAIELYLIVGGRHIWPDQLNMTMTTGSDPQGVAITALIWDFFKSHPQ
jgi:polyhydroxybutyrate depolymerase